MQKKGIYKLKKSNKDPKYVERAKKEEDRVVQR